MEIQNKSVYQDGGKKSSKKCSKDQIVRKGYKTKSGKKVESGCIEARSASGKKTSTQLKKYIKKKNLSKNKQDKNFPTKQKPKPKKNVDLVKL